MKIKIGSYDELGKAADELRRIVFIDEQGVPKAEIFDGLNNTAIHIVVFDNSIPVATARILNNSNGWWIGLVAVDKSMRGQHLGENVIKVAIEHIISNGGGEVLLTSQQQVCKFYEKFGFLRCGEAEVFESGFVLVPMKVCL